MEVKPIKKIEIKKEIKNESPNYPKYYCNALMRSVVREHAPNQFDRIEYNNQKESITKWFIFSFDCIKNKVDVKAWLENYQPSNAQEFDGVAQEALAWLAEHVGKYGYSLEKISRTTETIDNN